MVGKETVIVDPDVLCRRRRAGNQATSWEKPPSRQRKLVRGEREPESFVAQGLSGCGHAYGDPGVPSGSPFYQKPNTSCFRIKPGLSCVPILDDAETLVCHKFLLLRSREAMVFGGSCAALGPCLQVWISWFLCGCWHSLGLCAVDQL